MLTRFANAVCAAVLVLGLAPLLPAALAQTPTFAPQRLIPIPALALRAQITFNGSQFVLVDGKNAQMAPGVRIFGPDNLLLLYGALNGVGTAKYTLEPSTGLVQNVWFLTPDEIAVPDPKPDPNNPNPNLIQ